MVFEQLYGIDEGEFVFLGQLGLWERYEDERKGQHSNHGSGPLHRNHRIV